MSERASPAPNEIAVGADVAGYCNPNCNPVELKIMFLRTWNLTTQQCEPGASAPDSASSLPWPA